MSLVEDALSGPSVFKDAAKLSFDYVPDGLPHRDDVIRQLGTMFRGVVEGQTSQTASLMGPVGTGKTVVARFFARELREAMRKRGRDLKVAYVNCRNERTSAMVMTNIVRSLDRGFPDRGFSIPEMLDALRRLIEKGNSHLLVILDEIDVLFATKTDLVYNLSRFSTTGGPAVSVLAISQTDIFPKLDEATASTFKRTNTLELTGYGRKAMMDIVNQRVDLAFHAGTFPEDVAELVAEIAVEKKQGNARLAVELLETAGRRADSRGEGLVKADDVRAAKGTLYPELPESKLRELPLHEMLLLLAIARRLARDGGAYAITGKVETSYKLACEEFGETARGHTQFWQYLKNLASYRFIDLRTSGEGHPGTTQLISLPDVPADEFAERLMALLADVGKKKA